MTPLKILVSAYACEPGAGSEPGAGWNLVREISKTVECWIITRPYHRDIIEKFLAQNPMPGAHFFYYDLPHWASFWKKGQRRNSCLLLSLATRCLPLGKEAVSRSWV